MLCFTLRWGEIVKGSGIQISHRLSKIKKFERGGRACKREFGQEPEALGCPAAKADLNRTNQRLNSSLQIQQYGHCAYYIKLQSRSVFLQHKDVGVHKQYLKHKKEVNFISWKQNDSAMFFGR
jgi:hypothetical protein